MTTRACSLKLTFTTEPDNHDTGSNHGKTCANLSAYGLYLPWSTVKGVLMKFAKRVRVIVLALLLLGCWNAECFASEDSVFMEVFKDAMVGGLAGGLVGAAVLAFTKHPGHHLDYMAYGAAGGVVAGGAYGLVNAKGSLMEIKNGEVTFDVPIIMPDIKESRTKGTNVVITTDFISGDF